MVQTFQEDRRGWRAGAFKVNPVGMTLSGNGELLRSVSLHRHVTTTVRLAREATG